MPRNPWLDLPEKPPYVLVADCPHVEAFNDQQTSGDYRLSLDMMPEPFGGDRRAQLVLLNRNPGCGPGDLDVHRKNRRYVAATRANLSSNTGEHVSVALLPEFADTPAAKWCRRSFKPLIEHLGSAEALAGRLLSIEFHGYHSVKWKPLSITLPSQRYGFWLVEQAIGRGATIVVIRGRRDWEVAVPALRGYRHRVDLSNPRCSVISARNCSRDGFARVLAALGE